MRNSKQIFDELLVLNAQSGDAKAFGLLVKRWNTKIYQHINWMIQDREVANDLCQESWIVVDRTIKKLTDPRKFGAWVIKIAHNKTIDFLRQSKRQSQVKENLKLDLEYTINIDVGSNKEDLFEALKQGLDLLGHDQLTVIRMHYLQELSVIQMSEILDIPEGTVKSRLYKAREKLKKLIDLKENES